MLALPAAAAVTAESSCGIPGFQEAALRQVNEARAAARRCGNTTMPPAPPLAWNDSLFNAALEHSSDMARREYFDHASPEGSRVGSRVTAAGYVWRQVGENIAGGDKSLEGVMGGWMRSPAHCGNIMQPAYTDVAIACVERNYSTWGTYWTMVLGRRR